MNTTSSRSTKLHKLINITIKIIIVFVGAWFIYNKLTNNKDLTEFGDIFRISFSSRRDILLIVAAVCLMPINLLFESRKWQLLVSKIEHVRIGRVLTAVMSGISASMFMPNRIGEGLGRIFILEKGNRLKALMASLVGNLSQLLCTLVFGMIAVCVAFPLFYAENNLIPSWLYWCLCVVVAGMATCLVICYFNIQIVCKLRFLFPKKIRPKVDYYIEVFKQFSGKELAHVLLLSTLRYLTFSFQFVLLIWAFHLPLGYFESMMLIMLMYFLLSLIPIITIAEPAIRGSVSIFIFEKWFVVNALSASTASVFAASTLLWVINLVIPALLGLLFVYRLKFVRNV